MRHKTHKRSNPLESIFGNIFDVSISEALGADFIATTPAANVVESETEFIVQLFAPGLKKSNFDISIADNQLKVKAKQEQDAQDNSSPKYTRREFSYQSFSRSFALDETIDITDIKALYINGVLSVHLAKKEEAKEKGPLVIKIK